MSNEEIESLISGNPEVFAGLTNNLADYKEAKQNKLQSNLVQLNRKIHNSTEKISSIMNSVVKEERDRTEGYYVIGLNIMSVLDYLFKNTSNTNKKNNKTKNYKSQFKKLGEFINVNKDEIDYLKPKLLKQSQNNSSNITNNTTIKNLATRSTKFNNAGKISPVGLLTMTRTLFMTKKTEKQWLKVVYLLELIFNNVGRIQHLNREEFFSQKTPLDLELIAELEEIYNTQDIFDVNKGGINTEAYEFYSKQD